MLLIFFAVLVFSISWLEDHLLSETESYFVGFVLAIILWEFYTFLLRISSIPLNIILLDITKDFFYCFIVLSLVFFYRFIRKRIIRKKVFYIAWLLFLMLSVPHIPVLLGYSTTQIGDFYEAKEYKEKYIVLMSREPQSVENRKQYTLPAEIERRYDYEGCDDYGNESYTLCYHINHLYFPNGGYLTFDYDSAYEEPSYTALQVNKEEEVMDYHEDYYYITLTDKKAH